ncbi:DNA-binding GntR family transcriptional regulator [Aquamicrobium terrae]
MAVNAVAKDTTVSGAGQAAKQILDDIISGDLKAGSRLYIRDLMMRTGLGPTPLREGISRLVASGLVKAIDQRGFIVTRIERPEVDDYTSYRLLHELEAIRHSIALGPAEWENSVSAAVDAMEQYESRPRERRRDALGRYSDAHKNFHLALASACPSHRLISNLTLLLDQEKFYCHNLVAADDPLADLARLHPTSEHKALAEAAISRDAEKAMRLLVDHQWRLAGELRSRLSK